MVRLYFTSGDLARIRVAPLGPMAECQLALTAAQHRAGGALFDGWRAKVRAGLPADARSLAAAWARPRWNLDLYTTLGPVTSLTEGVDRLLSGPAPLRTELPRYPPGFWARSPDWLFGGVGGGGKAAGRLAGAFTAAYEVAVAPHWDRVRTAQDAEQAAVGRIMATRGVQALLESLGRWASWQESVLTLDYTSPSGCREVHLSGRGLLLAPSFFCRKPQLYRPPGDGPALLIYPLAHDPLALAELLAPCRPQPGQALAALLGRTRAAVLETVEGGATTGDIARRLRVAPSSASKHASVLREAGLVTSRREREHVWHMITPAGRQLLNGPGAR